MKRLFIYLILLFPCLVHSQKIDELTETEKIYGLSKIWSEVKANYVNFETLPFNWDELYLEYLDKIQETANIYEYYKVLQKFCAKLNDGHSLVTLPEDIRQLYNRSFPLRTELIEDRVIITEVYNDSLKNIGLKKGDEIIEIDGVNIHEYAEKNIKPYISASTEHDLKFRTYTYKLLKGHKDSIVKLTIKNQKNKVWTSNLSRSLERNLFKRKPNLDFRVTDDNIGVLTLNSFGYSDFYEKFDSIYPILKKTKGLVIDNRTNGGGSSAQGYHIISHLTDKPFYGTFWVSRQDIPKINASSSSIGTNYFFQQRKMYNPSKKEKYKNPVVLLISNATFSAAEDFTAIFKNLALGKIIGQPTGGSSGQPIIFSLPGEGKIKICTERNSFPDGTEFVGIGVQPDVFIKKDVIGFRANRDVTMLKALEVLFDK